MTQTIVDAVPESTKRTALASVGTAHAMHDGTNDAIYVLLPLWAEAFGLSYAQIGLLKSAFSGALAVFQMPAGLASERIGERALLVGGTLIMGFAFALTASAGGFWPLLGLLFVGGMASAVQHPLGASIVSGVYDRDGRRAALGVYNFSGDVGKMCGAFAMGLMAGTFGWQSGTVVHGIVAMLCAGGLYWALAGLPRRRTSVAGTGLAGGRAAALGDWGFTDGRGFAILSSISVMDSACRTGLLTFLPFLLIAKGATAAGIGVALTAVFVGGATGKLLCGLCAARVGIIRTVMLTTLSASALMAAVIATPLPWAYALLPLLGVALNGTSSVLYGTVGEFVREDRQARAFGLFYTMGSVASTVAPVAFGLVGDATGVATALVAVAALCAAVAPVALALRPHLRAD